MNNKNDPARTHRVVAAMSRVARPILLDLYPNPSACIEATKVGVEVLSAFGVKARPLTVEALLFNRAAITVVEEGGNLPAILAAADPQADPECAWSVGVGVRGERPHNANSWPGHLLISVRSAGLLVDLTLDQGARPHRQIKVGPSVFEVPTESRWWAGDLPAEFTAGDGVWPTRVVVTAHPADVSYRATPAWLRPSPSHRRMAMVARERIEEAVRTHLREGRGNR